MEINEEHSNMLHFLVESPQPDPVFLFLRLYQFVVYHVTPYFVSERSYALINECEQTD